MAYSIKSKDDSTQDILNLFEFSHILFNYTKGWGIAVVNSTANH